MKWIRLRTVRPKTVAAGENMNVGGTVSSNNEDPRMANRRACQRYEGFFQFFAYQIDDLFYYDADLDIQRLFSPDWAPYPSHHVQIVPRAVRSGQSCGRSTLLGNTYPVYAQIELPDLDRRMVDRPHPWLDPEAQPLTKGKQKTRNKTFATDPPNNRFGSLVRGFQVFIKPPEGKSKLIWVKETDTVKQMQEVITQQLGYPIRSQNLIHGGRALQDTKYLWEYQIVPLSTIILNLRIRGGASVKDRNPYRAEGRDRKSVV